MKNLAWSTQAAFEADALKSLFAGFSERSLRFAVLRNHENLPESVGGRDIDILVHPDDMRVAISVITHIASLFGASYAKSYRDDMIVQFVLAKRLDFSRVLQIKIDLLHNRQIFGIEFLSAEEMLEDMRHHNGIPVVSEQVMLLDKWSFHLLLGCPLNAKYDSMFAAIARSKSTSLMWSLARFLPRERAAELVAALAEGNGSKLVLGGGERRLGLARLWAAQGVSAVSRSFRFVGFRLRDLFRPNGVFLSVSGPDGSGKTTVTDMVIEQLGAIYGEDAVHYAHFRPTMLPRIAEVAKKARAIEAVDKNYDRPHRAKPSGLVGSLARLAYYWLDYLVGYYRSVLPVLKRREVMLFDRYYYDMIADSFRSRIALPMPALLTMGHVLPLPSHAFFIQVDPDEIHRRKQELTLDRIIELNGRYEDLVQRGWLIRIDNNGAPEDAAAAIVDRIVADQDVKARKRLK